MIGLVVEHGGEPGAHVMLDVIGEHAQEDVGAHARRRPVEDRTQMDVDGLQGAERALDPGEAFVSADGRGVIERFLRQAGTHDINAVERRLGGDRRRLAMEREARLADDEVEVLGHLAPVDDGADLERNRGFAAQRLAGTPNRRCDDGEVLFGRGKAYSNRGNALRDLKRSEEALASYDKAIALNPDYAEAFLNQSLCLLQMGHYEQGWRQYEWRKKLDERTGDRTFCQPFWLGKEDIAGKILLIHWEQGLGDTIQFCRYVKLVEARGAKIIMSVQQPLCGLLRQISSSIQIIHQDETPTDFDFHCPLLSLPLALGTTLETIPAERQYLSADQQLHDVWSARLSSTTKSRIGLVWSGRAAHKNDHNRSIPLERLVPLLSPDAHWISLQKEFREKDAAVLLQHDSIVHFGDDLRDFSDTAALPNLLDLVITVDTSVAHLAGAMGKPVWILLPYNPDWRWLLDRTDSPWYPSVRLFRQQQIGDWVGLVDQVKCELSYLLNVPILNTIPH